MKTKNKNKKQLVGILAIVLSTMAVGGFASANVSAAGLKDSLTVNPEFQRYLNDVANGNGSKWGLVPNQYLVNVSSDGKGSVNLPAAYSLKDLGTAPSLRDQGADGICWAYSTVSAAESTLKKTAGGNVQFSAKQLDYLMGNNTPYGQFMQSALGITHEIGAASNFYIASIGLSSAYAPAEENAFFAKMKANDASLESYNSLEQFNNVNRAYAP